MSMFHLNMKEFLSTRCHYAILNDRQRHKKKNFCALCDIKINYGGGIINGLHVWWSKSEIKLCSIIESNEKESVEGWMEQTRRTLQPIMNILQQGSRTHKQIFIRNTVGCLAIGMTRRLRMTRDFLTKAKIINKLNKILTKRKLIQNILKE